MKPMLAKRLPEDSSPTVFINNPAWIIQQKLDGDRLYGEVEAREVKGWSRRPQGFRRQVGV
jgi:ATP-dependent DNA ligase